MEILKLAVDGNRRMVLIKDRISKVRPAQALFEQLAHSKPRVAIQLQFQEVDNSTVLSYGYLLPYNFPIVYAARDMVSGATQSLARFLFGHTILGVGIANAQLLANMSRSTSRTLLETEVQSVDGSAASFHVGDKYPIVTGGFLGGGGIVPPTFNFEDLGFVLKVTPHVHGMEEMSLEVDAEFKVLSGASVNGIPVISTRKVESKVRLRNGEWAVVAGLMTVREARDITALPGLAYLPVLGPLFRQNDRTDEANQILILIKPALLSLPASEYLTRSLYIGSETRLRIPL